MDFLSIAITGLELVALLAVILSMVIIKKRTERMRQEEKLQKEETLAQESLTTNGYHGYQTTMYPDNTFLTHRNGNARSEIAVEEQFTKHVTNELQAIDKQDVADLDMGSCVIQEPQFVVLGDISYNIDNTLGNTQRCKSYKGKFNDNIDVAVKISSYDVDNDRKNQENVYKKIQQDTESSSNHIARYYSVEKLADDGKLCLALATELCPWNLTEFIQCEEIQTKPYTEACREMISGLQYLHDKGISHRNLKPSNVLVTGKEQGYAFKLADFGNIRRPQTFSKLNNNNNNMSESYSDGWIAPEVYEASSKTEKALKTFAPAADVFAMGMLCVFVKSKGAMLFDSQGQVQRHDMNVDALEGEEPFRHLVRLMTDIDTNKRPSCEECLQHPTFWDSVKVLDFFKSSTGVIQADGNLLEMIEKEAGAVVNYNWREHLTQGVEGYIFSPSRRRGSRALYTQDSVRLLLRAIRVMREHFSELPSHVQVELGFYSEDYVKYWTDRFPRLLMHVYNTVQLTNTP